MQVRLYKCKETTIDQYSVLFPYPKWLREHDRIDGFCIGCSQSSVDGGVIRCDSFEYKIGETYLGKAVKRESMSPIFHRWVNEMEKIFNDALKYNDEEHWERWMKC